MREGIEDQRWADADRYAKLTADALNAYSDRLDKATAVLKGTIARRRRRQGHEWDGWDEAVSEALMARGRWRGRPHANTGLGSVPASLLQRAGGEPPLDVSGNWSGNMYPGCHSTTGNQLL